MDPTDNLIVDLTVNPTEQQVAAIRAALPLTPRGRFRYGGAHADEIDALSTAQYDAVTIAALEDHFDEIVAVARQLASKASDYPGQRGAVVAECQPTLDTRGRPGLALHAAWYAADDGPMDPIAIAIGVPNEIATYNPATELVVMYYAHPVYRVVVLPLETRPAHEAHARRH